jgi:predicted  nucleic acid-binding Zn-ribbon protein
MSALKKLQEKIEQWRVNHEALKNENIQLKVEISSISGSQSDKDAQIEALKDELLEKDKEIEKIISQVETLLA